MSYFGNIKKGIKTTAKGMSLTFKHLVDARFSRAEKQIANSDFFELDKGHVTIQYPHQTIDVPDNGRYQLDCEIDDCIVCDKCAKVCPVDCIEIDAIKSPELIRTTSDGSPVRLHAAKFDIDMAKCCFCGLCTTVCPTECLTMNSEYDYSVVDITNLNFAFANLTEDEVQEKRDLYEQYVEEKAALKAESATKAATPATGARPVFRPSGSPTSKSNSEPTKDKGVRPVFKPSQSSESKPKPSFKPTLKTLDDKSSTPRPIFKPSQKPTEKEGSAKPTFKPTQKPPEEKTEIKRPIFKPSQKPVGKEDVKPATKPTQKTSGEHPEVKRPIFRPSQKPSGDAKKTEGFKPSQKPKEASSKPAFKPTLKPKSQEETPKRPVFKPTLKPKKD